MVSAVATSYAWTVGLGSSGFVNTLLEAVGLISKPLRILKSEIAIIIGLSHLLLPYPIISLITVIQSIDPSLEEAGKSLGANVLKSL